MRWLENLLLTILGSSAVLGGAWYFFRDIFLERYKNQLSSEAEQQKHELTKELEKFKRELDGLLAERQARFSLMHQKRAEVVAHLYGLIPAAEKSIAGMTAVTRMVSPDKEVEKKHREEEQTKAAQAYQALQDYFDRHRIFLSEQAEQRCDELLLHMRTAFFDYQYSQGIYTQGQKDDKKWIEAAGRMEKDVPAARAALAKDFRLILGITD